MDQYSFRVSVARFPSFGVKDHPIGPLESQDENSYLEFWLTFKCGGEELWKVMVFEFIFPVQTFFSESSKCTLRANSPSGNTEEHGREILRHILRGFEPQWEDLKTEGRTDFYELDRYTGESKTITLNHGSDRLTIRVEAPLFTDITLKAPCTEEQLEEIHQSLHKALWNWVCAYWKIS